MYQKLKWESDRYFNFGYILNLPKDFDPTKRYPLVIFLHGAGERGEDPDKVSAHGYLRHVREKDADYPCIILAPQCPEKKFWASYTESLLAFLDDMCERLPIDRERVYLTGLSMGGTGTWMLAMTDPDRFAAIAPICGSGVCWNIDPLVKLPIYVYHGDLDTAVPLEESVTMVRGVNRRGGNATLQVLHGVGHNAWDTAYAGDTLMNWFLQYKKEI